MPSETEECRHFFGLVLETICVYQQCVAIGAVLAAYEVAFDSTPYMV